jgi:hypothetical protein
LNAPDGGDTSRAESKAAPEASLEKLFARAGSKPRQRLMADLGLRTLDRQFPVGVYDGDPKRAGAISTGGKSAIDLVGTSHDGALWLFELKTENNVQVGSVSELFFYSMVANDAREGRFAFARAAWGERMSLRPADVTGARRVEVRLFAGRFHPLVTDAVLAPLNDGAQRLGWPLRWGTLDMRPYLSTRGRGVGPRFCPLGQASGSEPKALKRGRAHRGRPSAIDALKRDAAGAAAQRPASRAAACLSRRTAGSTNSGSVREAVSASTANPCSRRTPPGAPMAGTAPGASTRTVGRSAEANPPSICPIRSAKAPCPVASLPGGMGRVAPFGGDHGQ